MRQSNGNGCCRVPIWIAPSWILLVSWCCICLVGASATRATSSSSSSSNANTAASAVPWHEDSVLTHREWDSLHDFQRLPPSVFAPRGRLHSVELAQQLVASVEDPTSNLVMAMTIRDGVLVATTLPFIPNAPSLLFVDDDETNGTTNHTTKRTPLWLEHPDVLTAESNKNGRLPSSSPITRLTFLGKQPLFAVTAGHAVHGHLLRRQIEKLAEQMAIQNDDGSQVQAATSTSSLTPLLARRLADQCQIPTQTSGDRSLLVSSAVLVDDNGGIWQVDPTGQFWQCHAAVVGRGSTKATSKLMQLLEERFNCTTSNRTTSNNMTIDTQLRQLSNEDALKICGACIRHSLVTSYRSQALSSNNTAAATSNQAPPFPVMAFSIAKSDGAVCWYQSKELLQQVSE